MDFDKYCKMIECKVSMYLGSDYSVSMRQVTKNNGVVLNGIMAKTAQSSVCPTFYVDDYYNENLSADEVDYIGLKIANGLKEAAPTEFPDVKDFLDYEKVKEHVVFKLINAEANKELLINIPHRRFHNLAIVYIYMIKEEKSDRYASVLINNEHMNTWECDEENLYSCAYHNTPNHFESRFNSINEVVNELCGFELPLEARLYVLSNDAKMYGAANVLYDNILNEIYETIGNDFYILPSSIHELVILPDDSETDEKELLSIVTQINETEVSKEEKLADSVYRYNHNKGYVEWVC